MNKITLLFVMMANLVLAQKPITVAEITLKIKPNSSEELLYGFAEGDQLLFTFEEDNNKKIGEVAVSEFPDVVKFRTIDTKKVKKQLITVNHKAVFKFLFKNSDAEEKLAKVLIQRIPAAEETKNFTTTVKWVTEQDTTWNSFTKDVVIGYDTLLVQKTRKVVTYEKKYEEMVLDKSQRVNAKTSLDASQSSVFFSLPNNAVTANETKKVVAWAYWVGVGKESNDYWQQNRKMIVGAVQGATTIFTSPLGGIAAGAVTNLALPSIGEDVEYALVNEENKKLFLQDKPIKSYDFGRGVATFKRFTESGMLQGKFYVMLKNDNYVQPIDVNVKVSAIVEHKKFKDETFMDRQINPKYGKKIITEPNIVTRKFPATFDYKRK